MPCACRTGLSASPLALMLCGVMLCSAGLAAAQDLTTLSAPVAPMRDKATVPSTQAPAANTPAPTPETVTAGDGVRRNLMTMRGYVPPYQPYGLRGGILWKAFTMPLCALQVKPLNPDSPVRLQSPSRYDADLMRWLPGCPLGFSQILMADPTLATYPVNNRR